MAQCGEAFVQYPIIGYCHYARKLITRNENDGITKSAVIIVASTV